MEEKKQALQSIPRKLYKGPDARLRAAAEFVRRGTFFADVGCDHAYLSCYLCSRDETARGIASDLRPGPLAAARRSLAAAGYSARVETVLCDGLAGLEGRGLRDICILGMSGETIAGILARAPFCRDEAVRLILQPMTQPDRLRAFLLAQGYTILQERLCRAQGRVYTVICAGYTGEVQQYTKAELLLGKYHIDRYDGTDALFSELLDRRLHALLLQRQGRAAAGLSNEETDGLLRELTALSKRREKP